MHPFQKDGGDKKNPKKKPGHGVVNSFLNSAAAAAAGAQVAKDA